MLTAKEHVRAEHEHKEAPEFNEPEAWVGKPPEKAIRVCFAATNVEAWEPGTSAVMTWRGKRFRILCEGKDVPLIETTRGILVGE